MKTEIDGKVKWVCKCGKFYTRRGSYVLHRTYAKCKALPPKEIKRVYH